MQRLRVERAVEKVVEERKRMSRPRSRDIDIDNTLLVSHKPHNQNWDVRLRPRSLAPRD